MSTVRAGQPKARTALTATLLGAVAGVQPAVAIFAPAEPLAALAASAPSAALALVGLGLLVRFDRRQKMIVRELGRVRMVDRDHTDLGAALLAEMRQIKAYNSTIARELRANNERWRMRQDDVKAEAYVAGWIDHMQGNPPAEPM